MGQKPIFKAKSLADLAPIHNDLLQKQGLSPRIDPEIVKKLYEVVSEKITSFNSAHGGGLTMYYNKSRDVIYKIVFDHKNGYVTKLLTDKEKPRVVVRIRKEYYVSVDQFLTIIKNLKTIRS